MARSNRTSVRTTIGMCAALTVALFSGVAASAVPDGSGVAQQPGARSARVDTARKAGAPQATLTPLVVRRAAAATSTPAPSAGPAGSGSAASAPGAPSPAVPVTPVPSASASPLAIPTAPSAPVPAPSQSASVDGSAPNPSLAVQNATHDHVMGTVSAAEGAIPTKPVIPAPAAGSSATTAPSGAAVGSTAATTSFSPASSGGSTHLAASVQLASSPSSSLAAGFDISAWQPNSGINWSANAANGARFVYIKATEGTGYASSQFAAQWASATAAGFVRGAYVFATPNSASGAATADYLVAHGGGWSADGRTLPPLLDIENNPYANTGGTCYGLSSSQMVSWITDFSNEIFARTGRYPALYTNISWWNQCTGNSAALSHDPYMPAYWPSTNFSSPGTLGASWVTWNLWQWADAGAFPGDQDVFNGSVSALQAFAANSAAPPIGSLDFVQSTYGSVTAGGWAADPSTSASTEVEVTVDGTATRVLANATRGDIAAAYPALGAAHGFTTTIPASAGAHTVCATAFTVAGAHALSLGCRTVTVPDASPFGSFDAAVGVPNGVSVGGWAIDPDATSATPVQITVDGAVASTPVASTVRTDVGRAFPGFGPNHGFAATVSAAPGTHTICITAMNANAGQNASFGCKSVSVLSGSPIGSFDVADTNGLGVHLGGWALDGDTTASISVRITIDGASSTVTANANRSDIGRSFPGYGSAHGFDVTDSLPVGNHTVCIVALSSGSGSDTNLGCKPASIQNQAPIGSLDVANGGSSTISVGGWALDPNATAPISVDVVVDGASHTVTADSSRQDVGRAFPGYGSAHGFTATIAAGAGSHSVCVTARDTSSGATTTLGCKTADVLGTNPLGSFDVLTATSTGVDIGGWAIDPDTTASVAVTATIDGSPRTITANVARSDIARTFPAYGALHGFDDMVALSPGAHTVCVTVNNTGAGSNTALGCKTVNVVNGTPIGSLDVVSTTPTSISVGGWALDPNTASSITLEVSINASTSTLLANGTRTDIARSFPGFGAAHGFAGTYPETPGSYTVCAYGVDTTTLSASQIGCKNVTIANAAPVGSLDVLTATSTGITAGGWALDPNTTGSIQIRLTVDGSTTQNATASTRRDDIAAAYPGYGSSHGFSATITTAPGTHQICLSAVDSTTQALSPLGCKTASVANLAPIGSFDTVSGSNSAITVAGWAIDPNTIDSITITATVDGGSPQVAPANTTRIDAGLANPGYGSWHGFSTALSAAPGSHTVCVTANDTSGGPGTNLGCKSVTVSG
ncbi:GH25 family lysozyme [Curtobacterium ammoniigenes]|uniref:GH25 family lysozyme n=1 Tax=Curtobacterium ammoniigenes TaxID=395387 RepID=UPI000829B7A2|nr:GH25 family lysozyme [Curtobacterium ammoniigenes]